jgi:hypothetical protein
MNDVSIKEYFDRILREADIRYIDKFKAIDDHIARTLAAKELGKSNYIAIIALIISFLSMLGTMLLFIHK